MKHKIALLADVHGNVTALQAVIEDSIREQVTEYWFLGDLILPGPGSTNLFEMLDQVNTTVFIKGNWEDCFLEALDEEVDLTQPSDIYIAKLSQDLSSRIHNRYVERIKQWPLHIVKEVNHLKIGISHNLPNKNYGDHLFPMQEQENFNEVFTSKALDIAVYAHVHHPLIRYSSQDQLIISPGSIGQPFCNWKNLQTDLRAQYAILEIDEEGVSRVDFRKVKYDRKKEMEIAKKMNLSYLDLYQESLKSGTIYTHNDGLLEKINNKYQYQKDVSEYMDTRNKREFKLVMKK